MTQRSSTCVRIHVFSLHRTLMQFLLLARFYNQPNLPGKGEDVQHFWKKTGGVKSYCETRLTHWLPVESPWPQLTRELRCLYPACARGQDKATAARPLLAQPQAPLLLFKGSLRLKQLTALLKCMATRAYCVHRVQLQAANHTEALLRKTLQASQLPNVSHIHSCSCSSTCMEAAACPEYLQNTGLQSEFESEACDADRS